MPMASLVLDAPTSTSEPGENPDSAENTPGAGRWMVFQYVPIALFSLKSSRATSTVSKTLLTPTPYAVKMAFVDAALRHGLTGDPDSLVRRLAATPVRIGVPEDACVTGTIQTVRLQTLHSERRRKPDLPPYRATIAMREFVHYQGTIRLAFAVKTLPQHFVALLLQVAPAINYLGKRGSFIQYLSVVWQTHLEPGFTRPVDTEGLSARGQRTTLDDFGTQASFAALNSFTSTKLRRGIDRRFVETIVPLKVHNSGPGFVHYSAIGTSE